VWSSVALSWCSFFWCYSNLSTYQQDLYGTFHYLASKFHLQWNTSYLLLALVTKSISTRQYEILFQLKHWFAATTMVISSVWSPRSVLKNNYRLLCNLNPTDNQICKAVKINNIDIWLRSGNYLHKREKPLRDSQTEEINYPNKLLITRSSYMQPFVIVTLLNSNKYLLVCLSLRPVWRVFLIDSLIGAPLQLDFNGLTVEQQIQKKHSKKNT